MKHLLFTHYRHGLNTSTLCAPLNAVFEMLKIVLNVKDFAL